MKAKKFQGNLDTIIEKFFFWAIPASLTPNFFSYLRIASAPAIYFLLTLDHKIAAFILFGLSASTDFIDGALARKRNQVTDLGKTLDPIADKILILTVLIYIGFDYLIVWVFTIFILFEVVAVLASALLAEFIGKPIGANVFGKVKMTLQSLSVVTFLFGLIISNKFIILCSEYILAIALFFAVLSALEQFRRRFIVWSNKKEA